VEPNYGTSTLYVLFFLPIIILAIFLSLKTYLKCSMCYSIICAKIMITVPSIGERDHLEGYVPEDSRWLVGRCETSGNF
jgi:hypothetical protein